MPTTPISPGFSTYPAQRGRYYLLSGIVRGALSDADVIGVLGSGGVEGVILQPTGAPKPAGWPAEDLPPLSEDERHFHAAGTWSLDTPIPTAFMAPQGRVVVFQLWDATTEAPAEPSAYVQPVSLFSGSVRPSSPSSWYTIGGVLGLLAAGTFLGLAVFKQRLTH